MVRPILRKTCVTETFLKQDIKKIDSCCVILTVKIWVGVKLKFSQINSYIMYKKL